MGMRPWERRASARRSRFYCDYCDLYIERGSLRRRREHQGGAQHGANVRAYFLLAWRLQGFDARHRGHVLAPR
jgi:hypothetical protein